MKKRLLSLVMGMVMLLSMSISVFAADVSAISDGLDAQAMQSELQAEFDNEMKQVMDFMNKNAEPISIPEGEKSIAITYEIPLENGEIGYSTVELTKVEDAPTINPFGYISFDTEKGATYDWSWTYDRTGFLGGSLTHKFSYTVNASDYEKLTGKNATISATPPQGYKKIDSDSYFTTSSGKTISTKSYVTFELSGVSIYINSYINVSLTGYYGFVSCNYDYSETN